MRMIRDYNKDDIDDIIRLISKHHSITEEEKEGKRKELEEGKKVLVYDQDGVKGICTLDINPHRYFGIFCDILISLEDKSNIEMAEEFWEYVQPLLKEKKVDVIAAHNRTVDVKSISFFEGKGFKEWFGIKDMEYKGGTYEKTKLTYRSFKEEDFEMYNNLCGEAFSPMREANDIRPFNFFTGSTPENVDKIKKSNIENKDSIYLFYDNDVYVGSVIIADNGVDDVYVDPSLQGKGYGRKIMEAAINIAFEKNFKEIKLGVVEWNVKAYNLYKSLGFEEYDGLKFHRMFIN